MDAEYTYVSTRWNPRPEQLQILRDIYYNHGVRKPSQEEVTRITQRLSQYGRIEEKNIFYWFQNQNGREKRLAKIAAAVAAPPDLQHATAGGSGEHVANNSKLETLPLFPMHSEKAGKSKQDVDSSQPTLELTLGSYSPTP